MAFVNISQGPFWASVLERAIDWQIMAENAMYSYIEQALFTAQTLLEMLSYVVLVEDRAILGEDGYSKLPASDRITLLCGYSSQKVALQSSWDDALKQFCSGYSIKNVGELIAFIRNKLIHPTKKNREYLDRVPSKVRRFAVSAALQIASLVMLKAMGYSGTYFDTLEHEIKTVPWS